MFLVTDWALALTFNTDTFGSGDEDEDIVTLVLGQVRISKVSPQDLK